MDNKLYDSINNNPNLNDTQKSKMISYLETIKNFYSFYHADYNFENAVDVLSSFKIVEGSENEEISYDRENNTIILGKSPNNIEYNSVKCLLELCSQRYDKDKQEQSSGIVIKRYDREYGVHVNKLLIKMLTTLITGKNHTDDENKTIEEMIKDRRPDVVHMIQDFIGTQKLIEYFSHARGEDMFKELTKYIDEKELFSLYKLIDDIEEALALQKLEDEKESQPKM